MLAGHCNLSRILIRLHVMNDRHDPSPEPAHEEELFVTFANESRLSSPLAPDDAADLERLARWLGGSGLPVRAQPRRLREAMPAFRDLRGLVQQIARRADRGEPPTRAQVAALNRVMRDGLHYHVLRATDDGAQFDMSQVGDDLDQARSAIAGSLAHYLAEHDLDRLGVCASETCRWLFVDRSPGGRRRWCDMSTCGNRAKVARHRARMSAISRVPPSAAAG
jgi:predicted RNA-binding Zn ribbon-like protein